MVSSSDSTTLDLWLNSQTSPHTRSCYRRDAERLLGYAGKPLNAIGLGDLQDFDQSLVKGGLAPVSRVRTLAAVKSLFSFCCRTRYLPANPAAELTLPPYEQRLAERIVAEEDVQRLLAVDMPLRDQVLLQLLYTAGLRVSEACGLRWRNLSARGDAGQVTVFGKNGRTRAVALPPEVWKMLNKLQKGAEKGTPVFASRTGQPLDRGRVRAILREAAEKAGVAGKTPQISPHWLRHAHASHALDHGAPIHLVQATLGHSSVATTSLYLHARPGDSSARFLSAETFLHKSGGSALPSERTGVMDVMATAPTAPGEKQMKTFTIDAENNITAHASRKEARESGAPAFSTEEQFADTIGNDSKRLVEIWNSLPGVKPVTKFTNRKVATERIWKAIAALGEPRVAEAQPEATQTSAADSDVAPAEGQPSTTHSAAGEQLASAGEQAPDVAPSKEKATTKASAPKNAPKGKKAAKAQESAGPREGSKSAQVVAMLQRKNGATLTEIMDKMGWLKHTVRGFMAGAMKKAGYTVESFKPEGGERTYRIAK